VALDAPLGFFDGNRRIAQHDMILHLIAVAPVHKAHMRAIQ
jgi:hypothetical protein